MGQKELIKELKKIQKEAFKLRDMLYDAENGDDYGYWGYADSIAFSLDDLLEAAS